MANPGNAVYSILTADSDVSGLVGTRVYPRRAPEGAILPYITHGRIGVRHGQCTSGGTGSADARMEVVSWAVSSTAADVLAEHVRDALQGYSGTAGGVDVSAVISDGDTDDDEQLARGKEQFVYNVSQEYTFWFAESIPA